MSVPGFESLILFVSDLAASRTFYVDQLGLPVVFEDDIIVVVGDRAGRVVLHRNDQGHDDRGISPSGQRCRREPPCASPWTTSTNVSVGQPKAGFPSFGRSRMPYGGGIGRLMALCWTAGLTCMAVPERPPEAVTGGRPAQTL